MLGITLGNMFDPQLFGQMRRFMLATVASTLVLLVLCALLAFAASAGTGRTTMLLATAPGSITEMSLTAQLLHEKAALVTAFHLVRIFVIMPLAPVIFATAAGAARRGRR